MSSWRCQECGTTALKWMGKCPACDSWGTLTEDSDGLSSLPGSAKKKRKAPPPSLQGLDFSQGESAGKIPTGIANFDRVLGGGLVQGSLVLIGGEPGIGKSTLILQSLSGCTDNHKVLVVSAEESADQVGARAERLSLPNREKLFFLSDSDLSSLESAVYHEKPSLVAIDSIQTVGFPDISGSPGSIMQVRECTLRLMRLAKETGTCIVLVGHITKDGNLAGPKTMEHMVDVVLYFEGERSSDLRTIRAVKNRFGATDETAFFEMKESGLSPVDDLSAIYLQKSEAPATGSAVSVTVDGRVPILYEIQSLVTRSFLPSPRRLATGLDFQRFMLILAVLQQRAGVGLESDDVYVSAAGGIRVTETSADLGVAAAIVSSKRDSALPSDTVFFGEIGLSGELRAVKGTEKRLEEASRHGFKRAFIPSTPKLNPQSGLEVMQLGTVKELVSQLEKNI